MKAPLLSICIATYNRAQFIGETLKSIAAQLTEDIEIVIVDGASTDNTKDVVETYAKNTPQIRYLRLPVKGGVDHDYNEAVEFSKGEYCWLFTDDDIFEPGAIRRVLDEIAKGYCLIFLNVQVMDIMLKKVLQEKLIPINSDKIYDKSKFEELFNEVTPYNSFIGCVVIQRSLWISREKKQYYGSEFIHVGVIFQAPLPASTLIISKPYISIRFGNAQWTARAFEIWMFKWPKLLYSLTHLSEKARAKHQLTSNPFMRLTKTIVYRALGAYSLKEYKKWFVSKDYSLSWRAVSWLIAVLPAGFVNFIMLMLLKLFKIQPLFVYDLENNKNNIFRRK